MITAKDLVNGGSASLVIVSAAMAGHYIAEGMSLVQWAGAICAVLGSVTVAVAVRVWPAPAKAPQQQRD
jgi:hypothetical protein